MGTLAIVEVEIASNGAAGFTDALVSSQIHLLVFDASPQTLNKHVVSPSPLAIHADRYSSVGKDTGERRAGELAALICVEYVRLPVTSQCIFKRGNAERGFHGDRQPPRQHAATEPIEHDGEVDKAPRHRNVRDVHRPDLVRPRDLNVPQQIRVDLVARLRCGGARTAIERFYPHAPHQRSYMPTADLAPLGSQQTSQHARTGEWVLQVQPIKPMHDRQLRLRHRPWQVVDTATTDVESFCLFASRQIVFAVNHRFALSNPALLSAPSKKSFSKVNSPILECSAFTSTTGSAALPAPGPKTSAAPLSSCAFQSVIWLGCTSNCSASCASVRSPFMAAMATFALKAGVWFRRGRLFMVSPDSQAPPCPQSGRNSTYRPVQNSGTTSARIYVKCVHRCLAAHAAGGDSVLFRQPKGRFSSAVLRWEAGKHRAQKRGAL